MKSKLKSKQWKLLSFFYSFSYPVFRCFEIPLSQFRHTPGCQFNLLDLSYLTCCRSHTFLDVTGVETASSFSANTSYKIVDGTVVIDNESFNDHDISDAGTSASSSEQSGDR